MLPKVLGRELARVGFDLSYWMKESSKAKFPPEEWFRLAAVAVLSAVVADATQDSEITDPRPGGFGESAEGARGAEPRPLRHGSPDIDLRAARDVRLTTGDTPASDAFEELRLWREWSARNPENARKGG